MTMLLVGLVLGALAMFAATRRRAEQATRYRRLYEEATKSGAKHLHDILTVEAARAILEREGANKPAATLPAEAPKGLRMEVLPPGKPFACFECAADVAWGARACDECGTGYRYERDLVIREGRD